MRKSFLVAAILGMACSLSAQKNAQTMPKYAFVDLQFIFSEMSKDSPFQRAIDEKQKGFEADVNRMQDEIRDLQQQRLAMQDGSAQPSPSPGFATIADIDAVIQKKKDFLKEFYRIKSDEIEKQKRQLFESDDMAAGIYNEVKRIAQDEGYTMILDWKRLQDAGVLLYYSPSVDISQRVIKKLRDKAAKNLPAAQ